MTALNRLPSWFKQELPGPETLAMARRLSMANLRTVCREAMCPNIRNCFDKRKATFLILGDTCTRDCAFCAVKKSGTNEGLGIDLEEPLRIAEAVRKLGLSYVVVTSVTRDDLADAGAGIFAATIKAIREVDKEVKAEVLIPDLKGDASSLKIILDAGPDVVGHNIETVRRLYPELRPKADYGRSLAVLKKIKEFSPELLSKSSIMLGLGETETEVICSMRELRVNNCDILALGQYLAPSLRHFQVKEFIAPERFERYRQIAEELGFRGVLSGPLVRSSYAAEDIFKRIMQPSSNAIDITV